MINWYYSLHYGDIYTKGLHDGKTYKSSILGGNCLCVFVYRFKDEETKKRMVRFLNFYGDEQHIKNIMHKNGKLEPLDNITAIRLNTYYKESMVLLKYFTKSGYKVTCYYKEPKKK